MPISQYLQDSLDTCLTTLQDQLTVITTPKGEGTHSVVEVTGWQSPEAIDALATYLVVLRSSVINHAVKIMSDLVDDTHEFAASLSVSVDEIVVQSADSEEDAADWKSKWRNPWIAEGIWHCCMKVAMEKPEIHEHGVIIAVDLPHIAPKDHGFDVTALYVTPTEELGIAFVETKAYKNNPNGAIGDATAMLESIESGKHDTRLRQIVTLIRPSLPEQFKSKVSSSLWKNERTLIPNPHYEINDCNVQWSNRRRVFGNLEAPVVIMPHGVDGFDAFFDSVAEAMRIKAQEVAGHV